MEPPLSFVLALPYLVPVVVGIFAMRAAWRAVQRLLSPGYWEELEDECYR